MHLQERFLHESVRALAVLTERIRTRLTQGAGRATRNGADYAAVLMLGREMAGFCADPAVQAASHPEIRAEISFGLDNSQGVPARDAAENLRHFHEQDEDWRAAEQDITAGPQAGPADPAARHRAAAGGAVRGSRDRRRLARRLAGGHRPGGHAAGQARRLGGNPALPGPVALHPGLMGGDRRPGRGQDRWTTLAEAHPTNARATAAGTRWLTGLTATAGQLIIPPQPGAADPVDAVAISAMAASRLRTHGRDEVHRHRPGRHRRPGPDQRPAVREGAGGPRPARRRRRARPVRRRRRTDSVWMFGQQLWVGFEAKSGCEPSGEVSAGTAREAGGHLNYRRGRPRRGRPARLVHRYHQPPARGAPHGRGPWPAPGTASGSRPAPSAPPRPGR
jgi:hypothetical protein